MRTPGIFTTAIALLTVSFAVCKQARAQSIWLPPASRSQISLEVGKPIYDASEVADFWTTACYLSGLARLSPTLALQAELPYSRYNGETGEMQDLVGNPYVGIVYGSVDRKGVVVEAGGRLPVLGETDAYGNLGAVVNGWVTDVTRMEAFFHELITLRFRAGGYAVNDPQSGMVLRLMAGGQLWIPTEDGDTEVFTDVDVGLWKLGETASVGAVISAKSLWTESDLSVVERSEFSLGLSGNLRFGRVEPGVHAHMPLGNEGFLGVGEFVDVVLGVQCTVHLAH